MESSSRKTEKELRSKISQLEHDLEKAKDKAESSSSSSDSDKRKDLKKKY